MKKKILALFLALTIITVPVFGAEEKEENLPEEYTVVNAVKEYVKKNYQFDIDYEKILDEVIKDAITANPELYSKISEDIMKGLDDYSVYYSSEEFKQFIQEVESEFAGIGAYISRNDGLATVSGFTEDSPAEKAGVLQGDIIVEVNGEDVLGKDTEIVAGKIKGPEGTEVTIKIKRENEYKYITIVRAILKTATVTSTVTDDNIGYFVISQFNSDTSKEFKKMFLEMKEKGIEKFIVDVRNNPGGVTSSSVNCAALFLQNGTDILKVESKAYGDTTYTGSYDGKKEKLVVLTNEYSASASEIFTVAIKDNEAGIIVGTKTYGKGTMQTTASLGDYGGMKVTMAEFKGPKGTVINKVGITPDEVIYNTEDFVEQEDLPPLTFEKRLYLGDTDEQIYALKERLRIMRYFMGTMDNYFDASLDEAVKKFQADVDLCPCGDLDFSTQMAINNLVTNYKVVKDSQLERAIEIVNAM